MYTVYWEYVDKAKRFIKEKGNSRFSKGSQPNAAKRVWKQYGIVPAKLYTGNTSAEGLHSNTKMYQEMKDYLNSLVEKKEWNEDEAIEKIKSTLNQHLGVPPTTIKIDGKEMTPKEYLKDVLQLNLDDYIDIMSLMQKPFHQKVEYEVLDNWWHCEEYYNVPLDNFIKIIKKAIREGYTVCIAGDTAESGYNAYLDVAMIPTYDIPSKYIDDNARQMRFSNEATTDEHAIHLVGYLENDGKDWYLIKDSGSSARNGKNKGYFFYDEDYVKLKMLQNRLEYEQEKSSQENKKSL